MVKIKSLILLGSHRQREQEACIPVHYLGAPECQSSSSVSMTGEVVAAFYAKPGSGGFWCAVGDPCKGGSESIGGCPASRHVSEVALQAAIQAELGVPGCLHSRGLGLPQLLPLHHHSPLWTLWIGAGGCH